MFKERGCEVGLNIEGQGRAFVPIDFDNDGDLDLFGTWNGDVPRLLENLGGDTLSWLRVQLSEPGNPWGVGAKVTVQTTLGGPVMRRDVNLNTTFLGVRPAEAHFGLGTHETPIYELVVTWPDGTQTVVNDSLPRQVLVIQR